MYNGKLIKRTFRSKIYKGTVRDYWIYIPKQYSPDTSASLMVFQDGYYYIDDSKPMNVPQVIDKLIQTNRIPTTICVFVNPGFFDSPRTPEHHPDTQRSLEYDTVNDLYSRFLHTEILPEALDGLNVSVKPENRAVAGFSSGGICAWSVAWFRPDSFGNVLSHCGSFVNIRGGGEYPCLIRNESPRQIRLYFQSGENDLDTRYGNWALGNKQMEAALKFKAYDYHFEFGSDGHNLIHGAQLLETSLVWLFGRRKQQL